MYQKYIKRLLDIIFSAIILGLASPVLLAVAILVRIKLGSPVLFAQERAGYQNKKFVMYKFRSMTSERDADGNLLPDEKRLTPFGKMLRATSLDELPGILNILKGDMSFVGPRPLLMQYVDLYSPRQRRRHNVKPGLTGLAQANGRNAIAWEEKFEFDLEYADHISFWLDLRILFLTALKVIKKSDITAADSATMDYFRGTRKQRFGNKHKKVLRVLFTSAGNHVELIQTFLYAAGTLDIKLETYGSDVSLGLPAMLAVQNPHRVSAPAENGYADEILALCNKEQIDLIIPLSEEDRILASRHDKFRQTGIRLLMSDQKLVDLCMDKKQVAEVFHSCNLHTICPADKFSDYQGGYPAMIELTHERKGIYSYRAENEVELQYYISRFEEYLIRPFLTGTEFEVDVFCDFSGNPIYITPKKRERIHENEISRFRVVQDEMIVREVKALLEAVRPCGPLTIGVVREERTGFNYYVSMRSVFSENVPVSIKAGADAPQALLKLMHGVSVEYQPKAASDGILFSRVEQSVQISSEDNPIHRIESLEELCELGDEIEAVIFDLDDTLYSQKEYMRSGLRAVSEHLPQVRNCYNRMCAALEKGQMPVETVLREEHLDTPETLRECLDLFIEHEPKISLYPGVEELLRKLHRQKKYLAVITDGKPSMQHKKIQALGLPSLVDEILITDELAGNGNTHNFRKPNDLAYLIMRRRLGVALRNTAYVGVDPERDFVAPGKLGMKCYLYVNEDRLYG